ncbi:hypothetical protein ACOSQ3_021816 [Xanthoceras sorbifolium]
MLAYSAPADATDEYIKIGKSTTTESLKRFCRAVVEVFGEHYLRSSNANDVARLLQIGEKRGFSGMLGRQYSGRSGSPTIILKALMVYTLNGLLLYKLFMIHRVRKKIFYSEYSAIKIFYNSYYPY